MFQTKENFRKRHIMKQMSDLAGKEFKITVIKMFPLMRTVNEQSKNCNRNKKCKYQTEVTELKNAITKLLKNTIEGFNIRLDETKKDQWTWRQFSGIHWTRAAKRKKKVKKSKDNSKDLWNNIKWTKIHIIWFPEWWERNAENFPNLEKEKDIS